MKREYGEHQINHNLILSGRIKVAPKSIYTKIENALYPFEARVSRSRRGQKVKSKQFFFRVKNHSIHICRLHSMRTTNRLIILLTLDQWRPVAILKKIENKTNRAVTPDDMKY